MFAADYQKEYAPYEPIQSTKISEALQANFVRKVFGITSAQLLFTTLFTYFIAVQPYFNQKAIFGSYQFGLALVLACLTSLALSFSDTLARKVPTNYILLSIFTLAESYLVASITSTFETTSVIQVFFLTTAVAIGLAVYAMRTKNDISCYIGLMISLAMGVLGVAILSLFIRLSAWYCLQLVGSCIMSGLYLIIDVKLIAGGSSAKISLDDYVRGAMQLYIDLVRLFLQLLKIFGKEK